MSSKKNYGRIIDGKLKIGDDPDRLREQYNKTVEKNTAKNKNVMASENDFQPKGDITQLIDMVNNNHRKYNYELNDERKEYNYRDNNKKRNIRDTKVRTANKGKKIKRFLTIGVAAISIIAIGSKATHDQNKQSNKKVTPQQTNELTIENEDADIKLENLEQVNEYFTEEYLKAYNKTFETEYISANVLVNSIEDGFVYTVDGKKVTLGSQPEETKKTLNEIGKVSGTYGYDKVLQVVTNDGKILGTYNTTDGEFIYSGNQIEDVTNNDFKESTLKKLGISEELFKKVAEVNLAELAHENNIEKRYNELNKVINNTIKIKDGTTVTINQSRDSREGR